MAEAEKWRKVAESLWELVAEGYTNSGEAATPASPGNPCEPPVKPPNPEWRWLSPLEEQIVAVTTAEYRTAEDIADQLKLKCSGDFRFALRNLVSRCILDSSGQGYRLRSKG